MKTLKWVIDELDEAKRASANLNAATTAQLAQLVLMVAHGFSGSKERAPKISAKEFLPFPHWEPRTNNSDGPNEPTRFILSELMRGRKLPIDVFTALMGNK